MTESSREPVQTLLDVVFYAPIGAFFHGPAMVTQLAERGRAQVANARVVGAVAVERGRSEVAEAASTVQSHLGDLLVAAARAAGAPMAGADEAEHDPGSSSDVHHVDVEEVFEAVDVDVVVAEVVVEPDPVSESDPLDAASEADGSTAVADGDVTEAANLRVVGDAETAPVADLPIPDYDNLSASQVVPRLDDLATHELDAVRDYEAAHRGRMTILSRIAQLQAG